jgi:glycogen debranching enzyme
MLKDKKENQDTLDDLSRRSVFLRNSFDGRFWNGDFYADRISNGSMVNIKTPNPLVPLAFGMGSHAKETLDIIESPRFTTARGVRTRAEGEHDYYPWEYHSGVVWSLTTAWASAAEFAHGRREKGWKYLKMLIDDMERDALGCVGECWNAGDLRLSGCGLQLWGSGFIPQLVDRFMLGIEPDAISGSVRISPRLPSGIRKIKRRIHVGKKRGTLSFAGDSVRCSINGVKMVKS